MACTNARSESSRTRKAVWTGLLAVEFACILAQFFGRGEARTPAPVTVATVQAASGTWGSTAAPVARGLLNADVDSEEPFAVRTPQALHDAVAKGRRNIEVVAHLDLTTLPLLINTGCADGCDSVLPDITLTQSIRGNCIEGPPVDADLEALTFTPGAVGLLPFQEGQCLIIVNEDIFRTLGLRLWLDNLYVRVGHHRLETPREFAFINLATFEPLHSPLAGQGRRYITRTTFQGDGAGPAIGVWAREDTYIENCTFANLGGDGSNGACPDCTSAIVANDGTAVSLVNSTFFDPVPLLGTSYVRAWAFATVRISGCEFAAKPGLAEEPFYTREGATIYADDTSILVRSDSGPPVAARPLSAAVVAGPAGNEPFLERSDAWFVSLRRALNYNLAPQPASPAPTTPVPSLDITLPPPSTRPRPASPSPGGPRPPIPAPANDDAPSDDSGRSRAVMVAIILGSILLLCMLLLLCLGVLLWRARTRSSQQKQLQKGDWGTAAPELQAEHLAGDSTLSGPVLPWEKTSGTGLHYSSGGTVPPHTPWLASRQRSAHSASPHAPGALAITQTVTASSETTSTATAFCVPPALLPGAPCVARLDQIHKELNWIGPDTIILQQYQLLGAAERLTGGQSVVAFATGAYDREAYALKFFAEREAFDREVALQSGSAVGALVPPIRAVHDPDAPPPPGGWAAGLRPPLPPCIVYSRGESLAQWLKRAETDTFEAVSVLSHVATRLSDIHAANFVHCDVKPAHILLLPRQNRWTVIDFDKAAAIGTPVAPDCVLDYAAPEVVAAVTAGGSIDAHPSMDAWALGVVAFELLTGQRALHSSKGNQDSVMEQMLGEAELPWEGARLTEATKRQLGVLRGAVLGLLHRAPSMRASAKDLCRACDNVVSSHTTTTFTSCLATH